MKGVIVCAVLVLALMVAVKDGRLLHKAGLTGSCEAVATTARQTGDWEKCTAGRLQGAPDLSRHSCTSMRTVGKVKYWRCPAPIGSGPHA